MRGEEDLVNLAVHCTPQPPHHHRNGAHPINLISGFPTVSCCVLCIDAARSAAIVHHIITVRVLICGVQLEHGGAA